MSAKTVRVEVRVGGTIQYSQDVDVASVSLERTDGTLRLTAVEQSVEAVEVAANPLIPPPLTPGAPDGHDEDTGPAVEVSQSVHDGTRDKAAEAAAAAARREARRQAAAQKATGSDAPAPSDPPSDAPSEGDSDTPSNDPSEQADSE